MVRNLLATLAFSQGVPMISHGDELGRTQRGNNNAYCQDNEISWIDWDLGASQRELLDFARRVFALRESSPILRRRSFFSDRDSAGADSKDVLWLRPDGEELNGADWQESERHAVGMLVEGEAQGEVDECGRPIQGPTLLLLYNAGTRPCLFRLPSQRAPGAWEHLLWTKRGSPQRPRDAALNLAAHSLSLLVWRIPA
jgi:glycogen operon protein